MFGYMEYFIEAMRPAPRGPARGRTATGREASKRGPSGRAVRSVLACAAVGVLLATGAVAETARMSSPNETVSLHDGPLDVEARWVLLDDDGYEVTATFTDRTADASEMRVVMRLGEGDDVSFSMPGHPTAVYRFTRDQVSVWPMRIQLSSGVSVSVEMDANLYAAR